MSHLSVQLYSVRDQLADDPSAALSRLAGLGFTEVELFDLAHWGALLEQPIRDAGLRVRAAHASLLSLDDRGPVYRAARRLGLDTVIEPTVRDGWTDESGIQSIADRLNRVAAEAAEHGLLVGYHNHWWEFGEVAGRPALEHLAEALHPSVVLELDVYWAAVAGADVAGLAQRLNARIRHLHIKDGPLELEAPQLPAGSGLVDLKGVLEAVPAATRVLEFDRYDGDVFEGLTRSAEWLRDTEVRRETGATR